MTPDTTAFRAQLVAQTTAATRGVTVPVQVTPVITGTTGAAALAAQEAQLATATARSSEEIRGATAAKNQALRTNAAYARSLGGVSSGAASAGLSLVGLRGATLAASGPFLAGAAGAIALGNALKLATSFNSEIAVLGATTGATGVQLEQAAEAAREFGRDITLPGVTAGDAAKTITEFSKAGLSLNDSIAATRGGLQLAQAAQLSYTDAVTLSANALNAFNLNGDQAVRVADTLANASNLAQGGIAETALALRQAASAAQVVGVSFEDTAALLTLLAKNGLTGSDAGTALRTAFLRLVNPSKEANKIIKDLGVNLRDAAGNVRPQVFADFAEAQRDLSVATQQANAAIVFGQDAFRAFGILSQEGTDGLTQVQIALRKTGTAAQIAQARMTGLAGAQENLSNQLSTLGETIGQIATPAVEEFVDQLAELVAGGNDAIGVVKNLARELNEFGPGPSATDLLGGDIFGVSLGDVFSRTNPITGVTSPIGQLKLFRDLFGDESEEAGEAVKNGGVELRDALETAGREAARGAVSFADQITGAVQAGFDLLRTAITRGQQAARAAALQATAQGAGQQAGLEEVFNQIVGQGGSPQDQIANLKRQAQVQARIIEDAGPDAAGVLLEARRAAQAKLASINSQITALENAIAADQQRARDEQQRIREESQRAADQQFLEAQQDARASRERLVGLADETEGLQDDISRRQSLRTLITQQIAALRQSSVDEKTKTAAIKVLVTAKQATSDAINQLVRTQAQQNREQREAAQEEIESANIALGQSILDLTGNKNPLLRALDAATKDAIRERNAAKKGSLAFIEAQTEINNLLKQRKDLLEEAESEADVGGTTLVDLFNRANEILAGSGNVGFDAAGLRDVSARPRIQAEVQQRLDIVNDPAAARAARQEQSTDRLIQAIDQLTAALTGNTTTGGPITRRDQNRWQNLTQEQRFFYQKQAKLMVEQGLVG